jgi:hypothetical protein
MVNQRTAVFVAIILLSPITAMLPNITNLGSATSSASVVSSETTLTYTTTSMKTYFKSTSGTTTAQSPAAFPAKGIGFVAPKGRCAQFSLPVSVTLGTTLNVQMKSNLPTNLYLLPTYAFQVSPNGCIITGNVILSVSNFTAYTLHWSAPEDGTFYLIFTAPTTILILMDHGSTKPVPERANITIATSTETSDWLYSATATQTYTTTTTHEPFYLKPSEQYGPLVGVFILLLSITLMLTLVARQPKESKNSPARILRSFLADQYRTYE